MEAKITKIEQIKEDKFYIFFTTEEPLNYDFNIAAKSIVGSDDFRTGFMAKREANTHRFIVKENNYALGQTFEIPNNL